MKIFIAMLLLISILSSCRTLRSGTTILPNDSFILGKNEHGKFKVKVKNNSLTNVEIFHAPIDGGRHSFVVLKPGDQVHVKVEMNTALVFSNASKDTATVDLRVKGDLGLSMQFKN